MAAIGHILEAAPAVGDLLVLGERVGDEREQADVVRKHLAQRLGGRGAALAVRMRQEIERRLQRQWLRLAFDVEAQRRHGLVEQAVPGAARGDRLLVEEPLELFVELVGLLLTQVVEPRLVVGEGGNLQGVGEILVLDAIELQLEEDQVRGDRRDLLLDVAVELGIVAVGRVGGIE